MSSAKTDPEGFTQFLEELLKEYVNRYEIKNDQKEDSIVIKNKKNKKGDNSKKGFC